MLKVIGVLINLGILAYLAFREVSCLGPEQMADISAMQNPWILSFVGAVALFMSLKN